jgi:hypothetical protein
MTTTQPVTLVGDPTQRTTIICTSGSNALFDSCANTVVGEALDAMSSGPQPLSQEQRANVATLTTGHRTHLATEENARTRLGCLRLTKGRPTITDADKVSPDSRTNAYAHPGRTQSPVRLTRFDKRLLTAH